MNERYLDILFGGLFVRSICIGEENQPLSFLISLIMEPATNHSVLIVGFDSQRYEYNDNKQNKNYRLIDVLFR